MKLNTGDILGYDLNRFRVVLNPKTQLTDGTRFFRALYLDESRTQYNGVSERNIHYKKLGHAKLIAILYGNRLTTE